MKTALVTGAGRGLGLEIARQLGERGMHVILGVRDETRGREVVDQFGAQEIVASTVPIEVSDPVSIQQAERQVSAAFPHLDVLVNNAGILNDFGSKASEVSIGDLRECFDVNFFGVFEVTKAFLPLLRKAPTGRIVNISSDLGSLHAMSDPAHPQYAAFAAGYQASKCAVNVLTRQFAKELLNTNIKVNSASPGLCQTDMGGADAPFTVAEGAAPAVWLATLDDEGPTGEFFSATLDNGRHPW